MRDLRTFDKYRMSPIETAHIETKHPEREGMFIIPSIVDRQRLIILATSGHEWDHISVSRDDRIPLWIEMEQIKRIFFHPEECVMQLHPPDADYVTGRWPGQRALFVLHLWKPHNYEIPRPPKWMVGANSEHDWQKIIKTVPADLE